jgi:hypothetical protein
MMNKHLLATLLILNAITFFSVTHIHSHTPFEQGSKGHSNTIKSKQPNETQLLKHLKNVKFVVQKHLKTMHENLEKGVMYAESSGHEDLEELAEMTLFFNLTEDFYRSSLSMQEKLSELITPVFNFICNNIRPLTLDEISHHILPYTASRFDKNTTRQLQTLFESLYTKHYEMCRNNNLKIELTQVPLDELFEQCFQCIIFPNELFLYGSKVLLQKLDAKIKELEQA